MKNFRGLPLVMLMLSCANHLPVDDLFVQPEVQALARSACSGDEAGIKQLIDNGTNPNAVGKNGFTPVLYALHCESADGLRALLENGADANQITADTHTPIFLAARTGDPEFAKILLSHGADINIVTAEGRTSALIEAFRAGFHNDEWDVYEYLLTQEPDLALKIDSFGHRDIVVLATALNRYDRVWEMLQLGYEGDLPYLKSVVLTGVEPASAEQIEFRKKIVVFIDEQS